MQETWSYSTNLLRICCVLTLWYWQIWVYCSY